MTMLTPHQEEAQRQNMTLRHAMGLDRLDRQNAMSIYDRLLTGYDKNFASLLGLLGGGGEGSVDIFANGGVPGVEQRLVDLLDNPDAIQNTASYKFRFGQGQEALERSLGAKGMLRSGNRLTELTKYGQDMGSQEYEAQFRRLADLLGDTNSARAQAFGSLAGALGSGLASYSGQAPGRGGTDSIWGAYGGLGAAQTQARAQTQAARSSANATVAAAQAAAQAQMYAAARGIGGGR